MMNEAYLKSGRTSNSDECLTPRYAVTPIIKYLRYRGYKRIWCPFDNYHSRYVRELYNAGFEVVYSHIEIGYDFFKTVVDCDCIVSNPPFSLKDKVLKRLYELDKPFAVLLPQNALQSGKRTGLFIEHGIEYLGFDKRICFYTHGILTHFPTQNHFASAYFCHNVLPEKLIFEHIKPIQEPY